MTVLPADAVLVFYNDLPKEQADKLASELESQSIGVFWSTVTYAPWRKIRTTYVLCENDQSFTMAFAEHLLNSAKATDNHRIDTLERCDAGHFVMISRPEWLVGGFLKELQERGLDELLVLYDRLVIVGCVRGERVEKLMYGGFGAKVNTVAAVRAIVGGKIFARGEMTGNKEVKRDVSPVRCISFGLNLRLSRHLRRWLGSCEMGISPHIFRYLNRS